MQRFLSPGEAMSIDIRIQAKTELLLQTEARFYGVTATALVKAIIDKVVSGDLTRDVLQGVDVASYQERRAKGQPKPTRQYKYHLHGKPVKLEELAIEHGIAPTTLRRWVKRGMPIEEAIQARGKGDAR